MRILVKSEKWIFEEGKVVSVGLAGPLSLTQLDLRDGVIEDFPISRPGTIRFDLMGLQVRDVATGLPETFQLCQGVTAICSEKDIADGELEAHIDEHILVEVFATDSTGTPLAGREINFVRGGATYQLKTDERGIARAIWPRCESWVSIKGVRDTIKPVPIPDRTSIVEIMLTEKSD